MQCIVIKATVVLWTLIVYVQVFDRVLNNVLKAGVKLEGCCDSVKHSSSDDATGYHTVQFLFAFGSSCLERYSQLFWLACF